VEPDYPSTEYEIVGIVKDTKYAGLREEIQPQCFAPASQFPPVPDWTVVFLRSSAPPSALISAVQEKLRRVNPEIVADFDVFQRDIDNGLVRERLMAMLSGFFGLLALLLAMIGLYGVVSYIVAARRNEIGIRMALGASRGSVAGMILRQTLLLLALGVALGVVLALAVTRGASSLLYALQPNDPLTLAGASVLLTAVALLASYIPTRRAMRVDPMVALKYE
jgi:ABC-type antimicrobial peptide transport system permease subunit